MEGKKKGDLTRWGAWQKGAWSNVAVESTEEFHAPFMVLTRLSGIACPARNTITKGACGSELWDSDLSIACGSEGRRVVICQTCGWQGCRLLGLSMNSKSTDEV